MTAKREVVRHSQTHAYTIRIKKYKRCIDTQTATQSHVQPRTNINRHRQINKSSNKLVMHNTRHDRFVTQEDTGKHRQTQEIDTRDIHKRQTDRETRGEETMTRTGTPG
jgi:hypothetical protein